MKESIEKRLGDQLEPWGECPWWMEDLVKDAYDEIIRLQELCHYAVVCLVANKSLMWPGDGDEIEALREVANIVRGRRNQQKDDKICKGR